MQSDIYTVNPDSRQNPTFTVSSHPTGTLFIYSVLRINYLNVLHLLVITEYFDSPLLSFFFV